MLKDDRRKNRRTPHVSRLTPSTAGPGDPAAHRTDRLPLLPSGPGGVHRVLSHRAQPLVHIQHSLKARDTCGVSPPSINLETPKRAGGSHEVRYGGSALCIAIRKWRDLATNCHSKWWRRGWDSNPRSSYPDACFPSMSIRPLSHLSTAGTVKEAAS